MIGKRSKVFLPNGHSIVMKLCGRKYSKVPMFNERRVSEARELTLKRKKKLSQFKLHDLDSGVAPIPGEPRAVINGVKWGTYKLNGLITEL